MGKENFYDFISTLLTREPVKHCEMQEGKEIILF
jgi:hypothetical protein